MDTPMGLHGSEYKTRLSSWDARASVRRAPMRKFEIIEGTSIFSPDLVATMRHPLVKAASSDAHAKILTQKLYSYLYFTEKLERRTVMPACIHLAEGTAPFDSPSALKRDASKILVDEAHHAECAAELIAQVAASTGEAPRLGYRPSFLTALADAAARANRAGQPFVDLTFVAVSAPIAPCNTSLVRREAMLRRTPCCSLTGVPYTTSCPSPSFSSSFGNSSGGCWRSSSIVTMTSNRAMRMPQRSALCCP